MSALTRRESRGLFPDLFDWLESPFAMIRPLMGRPMRLEDYVDDGRYVVRAELPGIDPDKDVEITVNRGMLRIRAERREHKQDKHRSEFYYGSFSRQLPLPEQADEHDIRASYDKGMLEVVIGLKDKPETAARRIPVHGPGQGETPETPA